MEQPKYDVFISYSRKDYVDEQKNVIPGNEVSKIKEILNQAGITYWFDEEGIYSGDNFTEKIVANIEMSSIFVFLSTAHSNASPWTSKEIACADEFGKYIIPVRIDKTPYNKKVMFRIADLSYIDYGDNPEKGQQELVRSISAYLEELAEKKHREEEIDTKYQLLLDENDDPEKLNEIGNELCRYNIRQYADAVKFFQKASDLGYAEAQCNLGTCYEHGRGVLKDYTKAINWYTKAAEQGHGIAQYCLARCYDNTESGYYNHDMALQWYCKAAQRGNPNAQEKMGMYYLDGKGVRKNAKQAVKWLTKAAEQGIDTAQFYLGRCYQNGMGISKDIDEAYKWYSKAATQGHPVAQHMVSMRNMKTKHN